MNEIKQFRNDIAASLFMLPCTEKELYERDFCKTKSNYGIGMQLQQLDNLGATYYKGKVIHIKKDWAKKNLQEYELF